MWSGSVSVVGTTLAPTPAYAQACAPLGGGTVGLVPFRSDEADTGTTLARGESSLGGPLPSPAGLRVNIFGPVWASTIQMLPVDVYLRTSNGTEILVNNSVQATIDRNGADGTTSQC